MIFYTKNTNLICISFLAQTQNHIGLWNTGKETRPYEKKYPFSPLSQKKSVTLQRNSAICAKLRATNELQSKD